MDKLKELISRCECGVYVQVNAHRDVYQTVAQWFEDQASCGFPLGNIPPEVCAEMVRLDTMVEVQFYPDTPVGFYNVVHFDLDAALDAALALLGGKKGGT